jgi:hypothetical protein
MVDIDPSCPVFIAFANDVGGGRGESRAFQRDVGLEQPSDDAIDRVHRPSQSGRQAAIHRSRGGGAMPSSSIPIVDRRGRGSTRAPSGGPILHPERWYTTSWPYPRNSSPGTSGNTGMASPLPS